MQTAAPLGRLHRHSELLWHYLSSLGSCTAQSRAYAQYSLFALKAGGRKKAAEQSLQYDVVRWLGYLHMLVIIPGKLREACYKQLKVNHFVSLIVRTKAIDSNLKPKSPYLLPSTLFCDVSLVMWTTTKEKWAVCVVTSMRGKSRCCEVGFQIKTKLPHFILSKQPCCNTGTSL